MFGLPTIHLEPLDTPKLKLEKTLDGEEIQWQPTFKLTIDLAPNRKLGFADNGHWIVQYSNGNTEIISSREKCYHLLICLEIERSDFFEHLKKATTDGDFNKKLIETFPAVNLIKFTLASGTPWVTNAVGWLKEDDMDEELEELVNQVIENKRIPQQARHQAFKVLKRWQKHQ